MLTSALFIEIPHAKPKVPRVQSPKTSNPLRGERLPIATYDEEGDPRNLGWEDIARLLRVRDLRVQSWQGAGIVEWQKKIVLQRLKVAGYLVQEWKLNDWRETTGFEAQRKSERLPALWWNGSWDFYLYWGHQVPQTPAQKRDDDLMAAAIDGESQKVRALLKQGANPRAVDYAGTSILIQTVREGHAEIVGQILAARKTRPQATPSADFDQALQLAALREDAATLRAFVNAGATPPQIGAALQVAASGGAPESVKLLLPDAPQAFADAALVTASLVEIRSGRAIQYPDIVKLLLTRKPSQAALDAALISATEGDEARIVPVLLAAGADVHARNEQGETALIRAATYYWYDAGQPDVRALLDAGADANARDMNGDTALLKAAVGNEPKTIQLLLSRGADAKAQNIKGESVMSLLQTRIANLKRDTPEKTQLEEIVELLKKASTK